MQNQNAIRADASRSAARSTQSRRAASMRPYSHFARSGLWRFRTAEPYFRPFKPFQFE